MWRRRRKDRQALADARALDPALLRPARRRRGHPATRQQRHRAAGAGRRLRALQLRRLAAGHGDHAGATRRRPAQHPGRAAGSPDRPAGARPGSRPGAAAAGQSNAPQLSEAQQVDVGGQTVQGYPGYTPGAPYYFAGGGGYPGGWYSMPFWQTLLIAEALSPGWGWGFGGWGGGCGGGYGAGYDSGFDAGRDSAEQDSGGWGGGDWGGGGGGDWGGGGGGDWGGGGRRRLGRRQLVTAVPEQLELAGLPRPLFAATPSKLATFDCPRRYRMTYLDRPAPPKGPPWAHNTVGAAVHLALARWWQLEPARRTPQAGAALVDPQLAARRLRRPRAVRGLARAGRRLGGRLPGRRGRARRSPTRAQRRRAHGGDPHRPAGDLRPGRPDRRAGRRAGDRGLQDRPEPAGRRRRARLAGPGAVRGRRRADPAPALPPGRAAPPAHRRGRGLRAHRGVAEPAPRPGRRDRDRHPRRDRHGGRRRRPGEVFAPVPGPSCSWCDFRRLCPEGQASSRPRASWDGLGLLDPASPDARLEPSPCPAADDRAPADYAARARSVQPLPEVEQGAHGRRRVLHRR